MDEADSRSEPSDVMPEHRSLAEQAGITLEEARVFFTEQDRFGRIVGQLREQHRDRFAHAGVLYDPPSFLVRFVGAVPASVEALFASITYPVHLTGDGQVSEATLEALADRIRDLLWAEGIRNLVIIPDTEDGLVKVTVPKGYRPDSAELHALFGDRRVLRFTTDRPVVIEQQA